MDIKAVGYGLRRKSDGVYVGLIPQKIAESVTKSSEYLDCYDEVAIYGQPAIDALTAEVEKYKELLAFANQGVADELARAECEAASLRQELAAMKGEG